MTAWDELRSGTLGEEFARLLYRCAWTAGRTRNFPPPAGHSAWNAAAAIDAGNDFLGSPDVRRRLTEMAMLADDDNELRRVLTQAVVNHLRDQGRATTTGRLIRRLKDVLRDDSTFTTVPDGRPGAGNIALADLADPGPFGGRDQDLLRAAFEVRDVTVVRWAPDARRESPIADRDSVKRVAAAVLTAAGGSLSWSELAGVVGPRFGAATGRSPATVLVDALDGPRGSGDWPQEPIEPAPAPGAALLREQTAREILDQLTLRERLVLAWLGETVRTIADRTGLPVSTAGTVKQRVTHRLNAMLADADDPEAVAVAARDLAARELDIDIS